MKEVYLQPGEISYSEEPAIITTVLGSCIAVCIFDKVRKTGGMCHYYLARNTDDGETPNKYGENAIPNLLRFFKQKSSKKEDLVVKIIGGGHVLDGLEEKDDEVGKENIRIAVEIFKKFSIPIHGRSVGGYFGKKVRFETDTGNVYVRNIIKKEKKKRVHEPDKKIKVLVVDDSSAIRKIVKNMVEKSPEFTVIGEAADPIDAEEFIKRNRPDVITLDINMPRMDGATYLATYRKKDPIPAIILTSLNVEDSELVLKALENGAFDYLKKPALGEIDSLAPELCEKLKEAYLSGKRVIEKEAYSVVKESIILSDPLLKNYVIAIGASTGGTEAIKDLLVRLPKNIPPIVVVQHIPPIFSKAFAERLNNLCDFEVKEAENGDELKPSRVLIAPGGRHLTVVSREGRVVAHLRDDPPMNRFKPSVDYMFNNIAELKNKKLIGILLTGMGADGAKGLLKMKNAGAITIAQDEASSVVYGMPKVAKDLGAASVVAGLFKIPALLSKYIR